MDIYQETGQEAGPEIAESGPRIAKIGPKTPKIAPPTAKTGAAIPKIGPATAKIDGAPPENDPPRPGSPEADESQEAPEAHDTGFAARPIRDRPRERLAFLGAEGLNDDELVALVFGSGAALPMARLLLDRAGGPTGLRRTGLADLCTLPRIGPARACQLKAALELGRRALLPEPINGFVVRSAQDVAALLRAELSQGEQEALHVFGLDARHRIRCRHIAAIGQVDRVQVGIADVFRPLVREGMAAALVAHNHPSGEPDPSPADEQLTLRLSQVGQMLGIPLLDHVVVARGGHYSFADHGLLDAAALHPPQKRARAGQR